MRDHGVEASAGPRDEAVLQSGWGRESKMETELGVGQRWKRAGESAWIGKLCRYSDGHAAFRVNPSTERSPDRLIVIFIDNTNLSLGSSHH